MPRKCRKNSFVKDLCELNDSANDTCSDVLWEMEAKLNFKDDY